MLNVIKYAQGITMMSQKKDWVKKSQEKGPSYILKSQLKDLPSLYSDWTAL